MKLYRSGEDYLKAILILEGQRESVRSLDVAEYLHVSKPSVSKAMKLLQEGGYLTMEGDKRLHLTPSGKTVAEAVYEKHSILYEALLAIGVAPETAQRDACEIEHGISEETYIKVKAFLSRWGSAGNPV